ncbi:hypothetical protein M9H77_23769 [Catharanthus roseus]|uniref:Uncharacterized protein n=1 Tax=Catharanthus roseus TaxID=4058 RepID=A0ACC0AV05_CATRO|nr:hypothetical protein M9H77_23769 [Catharanthus roseus]
MKMTWKKKSTKKSSKRPLSQFSNLPFEQEEVTSVDVVQENHSTSTELQKNFDSDENKRVARVYEEQGNKLAENGKYREALGKWETALTLIPDRATLHEQKAQVLLEIGEAWNALKAATQFRIQHSYAVDILHISFAGATELEPKWAEEDLLVGKGKNMFYILAKVVKRSGNNSLVHGFLTSISLQAWVTLGRAQLNFGEPDSAIESFDRALSIKEEREGLRFSERRVSERELNLDPS